MGFFDKINNSMMVDTFNQLRNRRDREIFLMMFCKLVHSTNICFTLGGSVCNIQYSEVGGLSPKWWWVEEN